MKFIAMVACAFALAGCVSAEKLAAADDEKCRLMALFAATRDMRTAA